MAVSVAAIAADAEVYRSKFDEIDTSGNGWCFYEALIKATATGNGLIPPQYTGGVETLARNLTHIATGSNLSKEVSDGLTLGDLLKTTAAAKSPPVTVRQYLGNLRTRKGADTNARPPAYSAGPFEWADGNIMGSLYAMFKNTPIRIYEAVPPKSMISNPIYRLKFKSADGLIDDSKPAKTPISLLFEETVDGAGHASGHYKWLKPKDIAPSRLAKSKKAMAKLGATAGTAVLSKWAAAKAAAAASPGRIASGMKSAKRALAEAKKQLRGDGKSQVIVAGEIVVFDNSIDTRKHPEAVPFLGKYVLDQNKALLAVGVFTKVFKAGSGFNINDPLPPCNSDEKALLMECLGTRLDTLRGDVIRMQSDFGDSVRTRAGLERFLRLKVLIDALDKNDDCQDYDTRLVVEIDPKDDERIKALLRQFAFLILQGRYPLRKWVEKSIGAKALIKALEKNPISEEDMTTYMGEYAVEVPGGVPNSITNILNSTGAQAGFLETMVTAAQDTLYNQIVDAIKGTLEGDMLASFNEAVNAIGSALPAHQKILDILGWLVEQYKACMERSSTSAQAISELQALVEGRTTQLEAAMREAEAAAAAQAAAEAALAAAETNNAALQLQLEDQGDACAAAAAVAAETAQAAQQQLASLQAELAAVQAARGDSAELARVQAALDAVGRELAAAKAQNTQQEATIRSLQGQLDAANAKVAANTAELERLRNAAPETAEQAAQKAGQIAELQQQLAASQAAATRCQEALEAARRDKAAAEATAAQLRRDLAVAQAKNAKADQDAAAARTQLEQADADVQRLRATIESLQQQLAAARENQGAAAAAAAAAGKAATASQAAAVQQATNETARIQALLEQAVTKLSECADKLERARAEAAEAKRLNEVAKAQVRELQENIRNLEARFMQARAEADAAQLRSSSSSEADIKYKALIADLQALSTAILSPETAPFRGRTGNENFQKILGLVDGLRRAAKDGMSKEQLICIFAHYVNFFMHAVFYQKGGAKATYDSIENAVGSIVAGLVRDNASQKPSDAYYEILTALLPYVQAFEKVISMPDSSKVAGRDSFPVDGAPTVDGDVFNTDTLRAIQGVASTDVFTQRFGNDSMGLSDRGIVYANIGRSGTNPAIVYGTGTMNTSTLITYDKILGIFLVASQLYLKELKPATCLLPEGITNPPAAFSNARMKQPAQIRVPAPAASVGQRAAAPAAAAAAVSPRATPLEVGLAKLQQEAESDALKHGKSSIQISDDYRRRIADYKRTHGL